MTSKKDFGNIIIKFLKKYNKKLKTKPLNDYIDVLETIQVKNSNKIYNLLYEHLNSEIIKELKSKNEKFFLNHNWGDSQMFNILQTEYKSLNNNIRKQFWKDMEIIINFYLNL